MDGSRRFSMPHARAVFAAVFFCAIAVASSSAQDSKPAPPKKAQSTPLQQSSKGHEYSGMYSFLQDGEFVQITVEDEGRVTGFISRYEDGDSDNGAFLDQFFRTGKLEGNKLSFTTETAHALWFEFKGTV